MGEKKETDRQTDRDAYHERNVSEREREREMETHRRTHTHTHRRRRRYRRVWGEVTWTTGVRNYSIAANAPHHINPIMLGVF